MGGSNFKEGWHSPSLVRRRSFGGFRPLKLRRFQDGTLHSKSFAHTDKGMPHPQRQYELAGETVATKQKETPKQQGAVHESRQPENSKRSWKVRKLVWRFLWLEASVMCILARGSGCFAEEMCTWLLEVLPGLRYFMGMTLMNFKSARNSAPASLFSLHVCCSSSVCLARSILLWFAVKTKGVFFADISQGM